MTIQKLGWDDRFAEGPCEPPAVKVTQIRSAGCAGVDLRLANDPELGLVRIVGARAQLGPCAGLLGGHSPELALDVDVHELPVLARIASTWSERRIEWAGHVLGTRGVMGMYRFPARRYSGGSWRPETIDRLAWREGELGYVALPVDGESFGACPIEIALGNRVGERLGVVLRAGADRCVTLTRGSMIISRRWPETREDFVQVAQLLVSAVSQHRDGHLAHLDDDTVEFDADTIALLEQAARAVAQRAEARP